MYFKYWWKANLSYWDNKTLIGFDTGPGNILLDRYMQENFDKSFDKNGIYSSKGNSDLKILKEVLSNNYFIKNFQSHSMLKLL